MGSLAAVALDAPSSTAFESTADGGIAGQGGQAGRRGLVRSGPVNTVVGVSSHGASMDLRNKVVVVTGAGSGMGRELTLELLRRGARVAAVDLRGDGLAETARLAEAGERLSVHVADVADRAAVDALPSAVVTAHGAVDVLINNAGVIQPFVRVDDLDFDVIHRMIDVNFFGTMHVLKAFLPMLLVRPAAHVANVSSMGGFLPVPGQAIYGASKAAVKLMTEALYAELLETSVGVSVVMPGAIATNIAENSGVHFDMPADTGTEHHTLAADKAARIILDGIERGDLHITVGSDSRLMYLASRIAPKASIRMIQRQMKSLLPEG
jgi:short-subunit dehydrogenase